MEDPAQRVEVEVHLAIQPRTADVEELVRRAEQSDGGVAVCVVDDAAKDMGEVGERKRTWPDGGLGVPSVP